MLILKKEKGHEIIIIVKDTGVGIGSADIPFIVERFYRADKARSRSDGASGLGLAICKHIADIHKARIRVESELNKGSSFFVILPI